jgi:bifunctional non-homologous end joining protein LigD
MLSSSSRRWPDGGDWVLQPKWDGFRLLLDVGCDRRVRAWSRHGTSLTDRVGPLVEALAAAPTDSVFDGELVVLSECDGRPTQDFAAVTRGVFTGAPAAVARLTFVGFDVLRLAGEDQCVRPWRERDAALRDALPVSDHVRLITTQPASVEAHAAMVALGFEGTVLKRPRSAYRPGRQSAWVKHKARCSTEGVVLSVHQDGDGQWQAICNVAGRWVRALAGARASELIGHPVTIVYSRVDADGGLREASIAAVPVRS